MFQLQVLIQTHETGATTGFVTFFQKLREFDKDETTMIRMPAADGMCVQIITHTHNDDENARTKQVLDEHLGVAMRHAGISGIRVTFSQIHSEEKKL